MVLDFIKRYRECCKMVDSLDRYLVQIGSDHPDFLQAMDLFIELRDERDRMRAKWHLRFLN
jgi:hypothetical protein